VRTFLEDVRGFDRQAWVVIAAVGAGNAILLLAGLEGNPAYSLAILAVLGVLWALLSQLTRMIVRSSLDLAQESSEQWQAESDLTQEVITDYVEALRELKQFDLQATGIHLDRLRRSLIKRRPELEDMISEAEQPVNRPGFTI
jgi:hypothetical protein